MKYSRAALRRGAPRPQNAEARGRQARASADKTDPRRSIGGQGRPAPRHRRTRQARAAASADKAGPRRSIGGQDRPAPRSAAAAPARPHAYYISPFTLCQAPFFGFIPRALPDLLRPFMAFPCPFTAPPPRRAPPKGRNAPARPAPPKVGRQPVRAAALSCIRCTARPGLAAPRGGRCRVRFVSPRGSAGRGQRSKANPEKTAAARNGPHSRERAAREQRGGAPLRCRFPSPSPPKRGRTNAAGGRIYMIAGKPARKQRRTLYGRSYLFSFRHWRLRMHPLLPVGDNAGDRAARQHGPARRHRPARPRRRDRSNRRNRSNRCHGRDRAAGRARHPRPHRAARPRRSDGCNGRDGRNGRDWGNRPARPRRSDGRDRSNGRNGRDWGNRAAGRARHPRPHRPARPRRSDGRNGRNGRDRRDRSNWRNRSNRCHGRDRPAGRARHPRRHRPAGPRRTDRPRRSDGSDRCHGRDRATG